MTPARAVGKPLLITCGGGQNVKLKALHQLKAFGRPKGRRKRGEGEKKKQQAKANCAYWSLEAIQTTAICAGS